MVIAVENGLEEIRAYLRECGWRVTAPQEGACDVYVYASETLSAVCGNTCVRCTSHATSGVFLICARGRTAEEIAEMIRQKSYGKLF